MDSRLELVEALELSVPILRQFVEQIPEGKLHVRRGEGFWTVYEHVHHLVLVQPMFYRRIRLFIHEENPIIKAFTPDDQGSASAHEAQRPVSALLEAFASWRKKQVELIRSVSPEVWRRAANHPEYDHYTFEILIRHILAHDGFHLYRMEELWLVKDGSVSRL